MSLTTSVPPVPPVPPVLRLPVGVGEPFSVRVRVRPLVVTALLVLIALASATVMLTTGDVPVPLPEVLAAVVGGGDPGTAFVVRELRLPRVVTGLLVGAALGAGGALTQRLTRNPLGSPDFLGLTWGAAVGAVGVILLFGGSPAQTAAGALAGCLLAAAAVWLLAGRSGLAAGRVVLVGIGVAAMLEAVVSFLLTRARIQDAAEAQRWLVGSLAGGEWSRITPLAVTVAVLLPAACLAARRLAVLDLGDDLARAVGVPVAATRASLLGVAVLLVASATAVAGPVAFVALMAPQIAARLGRLGGPGPASSAAAGAVVVLGADLIASHAFGDVVLPAGVVTAALGGAYLAWLLGLSGRWTRS
jgi:iron complex transport system permease protein